MKINFFNDINLENEFSKNGYIKTGALSAEALKELIYWNNKLNIPDAFGFGYNVGMNTDNYELRKKMRSTIIDIVYPEVAKLLNSRIPYTASFMNKNTNPFAFVAAHQDWTFTNENILDSVMCWIPLTDVSIQNSALGFIPFSHTFYEYTRAFPFNILQTPVFVNQLKLMPYLEVVDMKAGEIIFFNQKTIHGSFANYSSTERMALSVSWIHIDYDILTYICNPENGGKTLLKYIVPEDFMVTTNYPMIAEMYKKGKIYLDSKPIDEIEIILPSTDWKDVKEKVELYQLLPNAKYAQLTDKLIELQNGKSRKISFLNSFLKLFSNK